MQSLQTAGKVHPELGDRKILTRKLVVWEAPMTRDYEIGAQCFIQIFTCSIRSICISEYNSVPDIDAAFTVPSEQCSEKSVNRCRVGNFWKKKKVSKQYWTSTIPPDGSHITSSTVTLESLHWLATKTVTRLAIHKILSRQCGEMNSDQPPQASLDWGCYLLRLGLIPY